MKNAAIYHFTDGSEKRPSIYLKQLEELKAFAGVLGYADPDVYCDMSLKKSEHPEFDRFMDNVDQYEALITKDFYHISKNTGACLDIMKQLRERGVGIHTIVNGSFGCVDDRALLARPLRAVTYSSRCGTEDNIREISDVRNGILELYLRKETRWMPAGQYSDILKKQKDEHQEQLRKMVEDKDRYDIVLVNSLIDIHWRTADFCKVREKIGKDIWSLQDGLLPYEKENQRTCSTVTRQN